MNVSRYRQEYPLETCMFSTHQLHTEEALRIAVQTVTGHLADRGISLQGMIREHKTGLVVIHSEVTWERRFHFFTDTGMMSESQMRLRDDGKVLQFLTRISAGGEHRVTANFAVRPIRLSGGDALDAAPAQIEGVVRDNFTDDEIDPSLHSRVLESQVEQWSAEAEDLGEASATFHIRRSDCEFADQWKFHRLPALISHARESLDLSKGKELAYGLSKPVRRFRSEWWRPMYLRDRGRVDVRVIRYREQVHFVYRVVVVGHPGGKERPCAMAIESY